MYIYFYICLLAGIHVCTASVAPFVAGGNFAEQTDFPFVCSIQNKTNGKLLCAGAIIEQNWIVTAAECVIRKNASNLTVVVGSTDLNGGGFHYNVASIRIHPNYINSDKQNNIALLKLSRKVEINKYVKAIKIAKDVISDGKTVKLAGWGATRPNEAAGNNLMYVKLTTMVLSECEKLLPNVFYYNICTKGEKDKGACNYDTGSPLILQGSVFSSTELHGIVSQHYNCGNGKPDVYVAVPAFNLWIDYEMKR